MREWGKAQYDPRQEALWQALNDVYQAHTFGFEACRQPMPGSPAMDREAFEKWKGRVIGQWAYEARRDKNSRGFEADDFPDSLWLYFYQRLMQAAAVPDGKPDVTTSVVTVTISTDPVWRVPMVTPVFNATATVIVTHDYL